MAPVGRTVKPEVAQHPMGVQHVLTPLTSKADLGVRLALHAVAMQIAGHLLQQPLLHLRGQG